MKFAFTALLLMVGLLIFGQNQRFNFTDSSYYEGIEAFHKEDYLKARKLFEKANLLTPRPDVTFNLAVTNYLLGDTLSACKLLTPGKMPYSDTAAFELYLNLCTYNLDSTFLNKKFESELEVKKQRYLELIWQDYFDTINYQHHQIQDLKNYHISSKSSLINSQDSGLYLDISYTNIEALYKVHDSLYSITMFTTNVPFKKAVVKNQPEFEKMKQGLHLMLKNKYHTYLNPNNWENLFFVFKLDIDYNSRVFNVELESVFSVPKAKYYTVSIPVSYAVPLKKEEKERILDPEFNTFVTNCIKSKINIKKPAIIKKQVVNSSAYLFIPVDENNKNWVKRLNWSL